MFCEKRYTNNLELNSFNEEAVRLDPIAALIQTRGGQTGNGQRQ